MNINMNILDKDWNKVKMNMPAHYEVCGRCRGNGKHSDPAIDGNGLPQEMIDDDPEFLGDYMEGRYDITCTECNGLRVVPVVDFKACTMTQKKALVRTREYRSFEIEQRRAQRAEQNFGY